MANEKTTLVIMAAGMGSRYGGLKQLDEVGPNGEAILDYSVYDAMKAGFDKVVFVIREDFEKQFCEKVLSKYEGYIETDYVFQKYEDVPDKYKGLCERQKPWGTTQALLAARGAVDTPYTICNADDFYGRDAFQTAHNFLANSELVAKNADAYAKGEVLEFAMVGFKLANTLSKNGSVTRGVCKTDKAGMLTGIEELMKITPTDDGLKNFFEDGSVLDLTGDEPSSMNFWCFTKESFNIFDDLFVEWLEQYAAEPKSECLVPTEVGNIVDKNLAHVKVLPTSSQWFGVTYKEDKPDVVASIQALIKDGVYPHVLFS